MESNKNPENFVRLAILAVLVKEIFMCCHSSRLS